MSGAGLAVLSKAPISDNLSGWIDGKSTINDTLVGSGSNVQRQLMIEGDRSQKC